MFLKGFMGYYKNVANVIDYEWSNIFQVKRQGEKNQGNHNA